MNTKETKLNKKLIAKMIQRIEAVPESYDQTDFGREHDPDYLDAGRPRPACGTVCCMAGEAVICSERSAKKGAEKLLRLMRVRREPLATAVAAMGITEDQGERLFDGTASGWPEKYYEQYRVAKSYKGQARAAVNLLKAILKTDGKILESQ